jgi:hypothetical protein
MELSIVSSSACLELLLLDQAHDLIDNLIADDCLLDGSNPGIAVDLVRIIAAPLPLTSCEIIFHFSARRFIDGIQGRALCW